MIKELTFEQMYNRLGWQYKSIVEKKGGRFIKTDNLRNQLYNVVRLTTNTNKWGLFIRGVVGNGKTTAVNALKVTVNNLVNEHYFHDGTLFNWDWMRILNAREMITVFTNDNRFFHDLKKITWLIVDDVGQDPVEVSLYGTKFYPFLELIDYRYEKRLPTIIVSNFKESELKARYGDERFSDRFDEMFSVTTFRDYSFRQHEK